MIKIATFIMTTYKSQVPACGTCSESCSSKELNKTKENDLDRPQIFMKMRCVSLHWMLEKTLAGEGMEKRMRERELARSPCYRKYFSHDQTSKLEPHCSIGVARYFSMVPKF